MQLDPSTPHDAPRSAARPSPDAPETERAPARDGVLDVLRRAAARDATWRERAISAAWTYGHTMHDSGLALYQLVKELDRLEGNILAHTTAEPGAYRAIAAEVHEASSLLVLAALEGFTAAMVDSLRQERRVLRHDLRNPVGTIKNALAMLADVPAAGEGRADRFRQMASRNATALEAMIRQRLADSRVEPAALTRGRTLLSELLLDACASVSAPATAAGVLLTVDPASAAVELQSDVLALELLVRALLLRAIERAARGCEITITGEARGRGLCIRFSLSQPAAASAGEPAGATLPAGDELAARAGACVRGDFRKAEVVLELSSPVVSSGNEREDVGRSREAHDVESGLL